MHEKSSMELQISSLTNRLEYSDLLVKELRDERSRSLNYTVANLDKHNMNSLLKINSSSRDYVDTTCISPSKVQPNEVERNKSVAMKESSLTSPRNRASSKRSSPVVRSVGRSKSASSSCLRVPLPLYPPPNRKMSTAPPPVRSLRGGSASTAQTSSPIKQLSPSVATTVSSGKRMSTTTSSLVNNKAEESPSPLPPQLLHPIIVAEVSLTSHCDSSNSQEAATEIDYHLDGFISDDDDHQNEEVFHINSNSDHVHHNDDMSTITFEQTNVRTDHHRTSSPHHPQPVINMHQSIGGREESSLLLKEIQSKISQLEAVKLMMETENRSLRSKQSMLEKEIVSLRGDNKLLETTICERTDKEVVYYITIKVER